MSQISQYEGEIKWIDLVVSELSPRLHATPSKQREIDYWLRQKRRLETEIGFLGAEVRP